MTMERRELHFETIEQVIADIEHLHRVGYTRLGNWGLAEICDHCAAFANLSIHGSPQMMPWIVRATFGRWIFHFLLRRGRFPKGIPAPKSMLPVRRKARVANHPNEHEQADESRSVEKFISLLRTVQKTREFAVHPFAGDIGADPWRKIQIIHTAHHLSFLVPKVPAEITPRT